ncbi:RXT2-like protein [Rhexocercosporidium sp. MPI-PUGE-AT-0058]|nr:RXT2-like protein [Rhexocercosporidium sp. MPI-PUGE-AT-0058]
MASQAAIFAETIAGMKKAVKRKAYDSDSDSSIENLTNRGNKLRKKARFIHEGQLAPPSGPQVYKRRIEHAGYQRDVISRNPPLVDEDGYEVDSDDDDERARDAIAAAAEQDPYSDVKIEHLLVPLTTASDLPDHPTLSKPFNSKTLTELTRHAGEMVQKEKASLWRIKHLLTRLSGDNTWYPCASVETDNDYHLFMDERDPGHVNILGKAAARLEGDQVSTGTLALEDVDQRLANEDQALPLEVRQSNEKAADEDISMESSTNANDEGKTTSGMSNDSVAGIATSIPNGQTDVSNGATPGAMIDVDESAKDQGQGSHEGQAQPTEDVDMVDGELGVDQDGNLAPRRMRTRAQAQAASDNNTTRTRSTTPDSGSEVFVHPIFLAPASSRPDRNVGLPLPEADETRRLLQLYIQKQEEVCRGAQKVYDGLLKADRYRKLVMKWAKAEGHVGTNRDMSDGEDWYDKEEWGLDEDLKKGQDEEEEDAATTAKKTRTRRQ